MATTSTDSAHTNRASAGRIVASYSGAYLSAQRESSEGKLRARLRYWLCADELTTLRADSLVIFKT